MPTHSKDRLAYGLLLIGTGLWLSAILAAPLARSAGSPVSGLLYLFFDPVCHQMSQRSFHLDGHPLAVCHRCTGLYLGFLIGLLLVPVWHSGRNWILDNPRRLLYFIVPLAVDWLLPWNVPISRFATGIVACAPVAAILWAAARQISQPVTRTALQEGEP